MLVSNDAIGVVYEVMTRELKSIGLQVDNVEVQHGYNPVHMLHSSPRAHMAQEAPIMIISFRCGEEEFPYLRPFVTKAETRHSMIPPSVDIVRNFRNMWDSSTNKEYRAIAVFDCTIELMITGGSMESFVEGFRKETEKLRYAIESKEFDSEVVKLLTDDGYNK